MPHPNLVWEQKLKPCTVEMYGPDAALELAVPEMGAEDFYAFSIGETVPVRRFWLG